jgi:hypothetical protein
MPKPWFLAHPASEQDSNKLFASDLLFKMNRAKVLTRVLIATIMDLLLHSRNSLVGEFFVFEHYTTLISNS